MIYKMCVLRWVCVYTMYLYVCVCFLPCWRPDSLYPGLYLWPQSHTVLCLGVEFGSADAATGCNSQARNHGNHWAHRGTSCHPPCVAGWWCHPWKIGDHLVLFLRRSRGLYHKAALGYSEKHTHTVHTNTYCKNKAMFYTCTTKQKICPYVHYDGEEQHNVPYSAELNFIVLDLNWQWDSSLNSDQSKIRQVVV